MRRTRVLVLFYKLYGGVKSIDLANLSIYSLDNFCPYPIWTSDAPRHSSMHCIGANFDFSKLLRRLPQNLARSPPHQVILKQPAIPK